MSTNDFTDLNDYVNKIDNLAENLYEDKVDVNNVEDS